jgi:hypothetical protein
MPILIAAIVAVGALCLLDLLLTFGVIRRLREHTSMLAGTVDSGMIGVSPGASPGAFSAVTTSGEPVTGTAGLRLAAFLSSSCSACPERVPPFLDYLSTHRIARDSVLAVVAAEGSTPVPYLDRLAEAARTCVEPYDSEIIKAFKVSGFPAFFLLDVDGAVSASGWDPAALPEPVTA